MMKKFIICIFCLLFISFLFLPAGAYDNDGPERKMFGGPHRMINKLALDLFQSDHITSSSRMEEAFPFNRNIRGATAIVANWKDINQTEEIRTETPSWWIIEGGYTADEPEIFNSFRHFYDPLQKDEVPYLTDHLQKLDLVYKSFIYLVPGLPALISDDFNPKVDAKDWAINGTQNNGERPNEYCWNKGLQYMNEAFTCPEKWEKERLFVKAWRSLGETMHLMADMTCVPHVRNDSHPGKPLNCKLDPNYGLLKNDPYELLTTEDLVKSAYYGYDDLQVLSGLFEAFNVSSADVDPAIKNKIDPCSACDIANLFHNVALYTNTRFFSADTVSGTYEGFEIHNANGMPDYDSPKLEKCTVDQEGYFINTINGKPVRLAHITWLGKEGWADDTNSMKITGACVKDQAAILIPLAVYANAKLIDWFVPRVEVKITSVDRETKELKGTITHIPYGAYTTPMLFNGDENQCKLFIDNEARGGEYKAKINNGEITLIMKSDTKALEWADSLKINVIVGGMTVSSDDYQIPYKFECPKCGRHNIEPISSPEEDYPICPFCGEAVRVNY